MQRKKVDNLSRYYIYDDGRIYSLIRKKFLSPHTTKTGHQRIMLITDANERKKYLVHRLVAIAFIPNNKKLEFVCHNDSNPKNNFVSNLRWDNQLGNMQDRKNRGMYHDQKGENNYSSKLSNKEVIAIKKLLKNGFSPYKINKLKKFDISYGTLCDIQRGKSWKHIRA